MGRLIIRKKSRLIKADRTAIYTINEKNICVYLTGNNILTVAINSLKSIDFDILINKLDFIFDFRKEN